MTAPVVRPVQDRLGGTDGNELLTGMTAAVLTALLIAEGITIIFMGGLRTEHMFIGLLAASIGGGVVLAIALLGTIEAWHRLRS